MEDDSLHFCSISEIAKFFGVSEDTVREWREAGAPLFFIGKKWQANYYELWEWLKEYYGREKN